MDITVGQFIDAIEKNGFPQARGGLFYREATEEEVANLKAINEEDHDSIDYNMHIPDDNGLVSIQNPKEFTWACAYGQGLINLGVKRPAWSTTFSTAFYNRVWELNDERGLSIPQIVKVLRDAYEDRLDEVLEEFEPFDYGDIESKKVK